MIKLVIPGKPIAKKRPRFARRGKFVKTYNDQETEESRFLFEVHRQWQGTPLLGPVGVKLTFNMPRPKTHYGTGKNIDVIKESAPSYASNGKDIDNLIKFVFDCLNGVAWKDDSQVVALLSWKMYRVDPKTIIEIDAIGESHPETSMDAQG